MNNFYIHMREACVARWDFSQTPTQGQEHNFLGHGSRKFFSHLVLLRVIFSIAIISNFHPDPILGSRMQCLLYLLLIMEISGKKKNQLRLMFINHRVCFALLTLLSIYLLFILFILPRCCIWITPSVLLNRLFFFSQNQWDWELQVVRNTNRQL